MKSIYTVKVLIIFFIITVFPQEVISQNGNVRGTITDSYGMYVPGAEVMVEGTNKGIVSNRDGEYVLLNIPNGPQTLVVKYLGYRDTRIETVIEAGSTITRNFQLEEDMEELEAIELIGPSLTGQARALNMQKNRQNISNIVSTDQIGKFPDANIGDAVKRIPGITMQMDQGEARDIIIRGLAPQLNSVMLNGSRIPSAEGDNRNVQMDLIPSDMIQSIEVSKAIMPDMDADALGGAVNLITRSSPKDFRLSATVGSGINLINDKRILNGSFLVGDRTNDNKFGWMVSASINDNDFASDNVEAEWADSFEYNTGRQDEDGEDILEEMEVNPYADVMEIRKYLVQRIRRSFSANFDYEFNQNNSIYLKSMYNWRDDRENRYANVTEILDGEDIEEGDFEIQNGNLVRFPVEAAREVKGGIAGGRNESRRLEDQRMQSYSLGGDNLWGNLKFDWMGSYAKASEERLNERYIGYESEYMIRNDVSNPRKPHHIPLEQPAPDDFEFAELSEEDGYTEEEDVNLFINFELPADFFGNGDGTVKFGARGRLKNKYRKLDFRGYEPLSGFETMADVETRTFTGDGFLPGSQYIPGTFASADFLGRLELNNPALFEGESLPEEFLGENFEVSEDVYAGYAMFNQKLANNLSLLAGVRLEYTTNENTGNEIIFNEEGDFEGSNELRDENDYLNILPGAHLKYDVTGNTVLRFAWTNTLARPNYLDLVPFREVNNEDREIIVGNTDLDPTTSMNFDFMAERYFRSVGILSAGVFYKDLEDFIYVFVTEDPATGYDLFTPLNGEDAKIYGAEASFQRQLDFLPGFARNFGIYLNYTYLNTSANGITNEDGDERGDLDLPGSSPNMFNASLSYSGSKFSARLSGNYADAYLDELGANPFEDRYYDEQFFLDFNMSYAFNTSLRLYADVNNITNQPLRFYQGAEQRTMQMEYYNARITFGLKYDIF